MSTLRGTRPFSNDDKVLLFTGRLVAEKGILKVPEILKEVHNKFNRTRLLVVGDGSEREETERLLSKLGIVHEMYKFTGLVQQENMPEYYSASDVFLMPSIWNEPFATCALEAMSSGCIPVLNNIGGIAKMLEREKYEYLVVKGDVHEFTGRIIELLNQQSETQLLTSNLVRLMEKKFTWKIRAKQFSTLYEQALKRSNSN